MSTGIVRPASSTGALFFDNDRSGHHAAIQFATLSNRPANLAASNFFVT
jgi:Ca2+-binding RTX toxin-like protein